ncbi:MAG: polysaccharide deacetylase family protein [Desulfomonile tiedjei]|uniref:Polysaccharide deacetylase family protein n=1 Tax=Desulfomonile tiedjei TaxID=2358 RepID=A0A9D6V2Z3_9BACT|nr:polysaccharide deacetylase family protein [Desulfomonile tiedjei]
MAGNPLIGNLLRELRIGYTTISAIDREHAQQQGQECARDLLEGRGEISIPNIPQQDVTRDGGAAGSFTLIFDLEQFGGARYGMPRLLSLLESSGIRAVFFVTGFIAEIYPGLVRRIADGGHEIGIHGAMHEFFQGRSLDEQTARIRAHADILKNYADIYGANLIFRMDGMTPEAVLKSGLKYFALFRKHLYHRTRYIQASGRTRAFRTSSGDMYFIPVGVETYDRSLQEMEGMIRSALRTAHEEGHNHVSILMHPFKDGALKRIATVQALIWKLTRDLKLRPVKLHEIPEPAPTREEATKILYRWDEHEAVASPQDRFSKSTRSWWAPPTFHSRRTENVTDALERAAIPVILSAEIRQNEKCVYVYPDASPSGVTVTGIDPIRDTSKVAAEIAAILGKNSSVNLSPGSGLADLWNNWAFQIPRTWNDLTMLIRRIKNKLRRLIQTSKIGRIGYHSF